MVQSLVLERPRERTLGKGAQTRDRILEIAEAAVLDKGFSATSIDEILFEAGLTKSGFFYHFRDKNDLALGLIERFKQHNLLLFEDIFDRAGELNEDPLHAFLVGLKLLAEILADVQAARPGCLVASFVYHDQQYDARVRAVIVDVTLTWRAQFVARLETIAALYPPRVEVDVQDLADMLTAIIDGGIILSKTLREPQIMARQVLAYRAFVRTVFLGA